MPIADARRGTVLQVLTSFQPGEADGSLLIPLHVGNLVGEANIRAHLITNPVLRVSIVIVVSVRCSGHTPSIAMN